MGDGPPVGGPVGGPRDGAWPAEGRPGEGDGCVGRDSAGYSDGGNTSGGRSSADRMRAGDSDASAGGHDGVSRHRPRHLAPTASIDALISFTYHLPH